MKPIEGSSIRALVPRGLITRGKVSCNASVTADGLCPLQVSWNDGVVSRIECIEYPSPNRLNLLLPRLVEPHAHIDKAFTWNSNPNFLGTYDAALKENLLEHQTRDLEKTILRVEKALSKGLKNGLRAIRSHVDVFGPKPLEIWEALFDVQKRWKDLIELQFVALAPLQYWTTREGRLFASEISKSGGILGGVLLPPFKTSETREILRQLISLANDCNCEVDLHVDESEKNPAAGLRLFVKLIENSEIKIPITFSHASSMSLLPSCKLKHLADQLARNEINIIALPLTNAWLLNRQNRNTPAKRPLAPISQLQKAGVTVAIGGDNVQDPWFPTGNFDPIALMSCSLPITQLAPWHRLGLAPFTTASSHLMSLEWDGTIDVGNPADFMLLESNSWSETLSNNPSRQILIKGEWTDLRL